jgi:hypothetical protein
MTGLRWTYSDLIHYYKQTGISHLNPLIEQLLLACPCSSVFTVGGHFRRITDLAKHSGKGGSQGRRE